jgi:hypothetical protein
MSAALRKDMLLEIGHSLQRTHPCLQHHVLQVNIVWCIVCGLYFVPARFDVFTAVLLQSKSVCDVKPC